MLHDCVRVFCILSKSAEEPNRKSFSNKFAVGLRTIYVESRLNKIVVNRRYREKNWLEGEVRAGKSPRQIAVKCDVTTETIERWIQKHSIAPYQDKQWLEEKISNYWPVCTLAEWCCVTERTINRWIAKFGIEHPGLAPPDVLQSYLQERLDMIGDEFTVPKNFQIKRLRERFNSPASDIAQVVDTDKRYVYHVLSGQTEWGRSESVSTVLREQILSRDNHRCVRCGSFENVDLQVHHVIPGESTKENLATLCFDCHLDAHGGNFGGSLAYDSREEFWDEWLETP